MGKECRKCIRALSDFNSKLGSLESLVGLKEWNPAESTIHLTLKYDFPELSPCIREPGELRKNLEALNESIKSKDKAKALGKLADITADMEIDYPVQIARSCQLEMED
jgi:hypothetical protein